MLQKRDGWRYSPQFADLEMLARGSSGKLRIVSDLRPRAADVRHWHKADNPLAPQFVRCWTKADMKTTTYFWLLTLRS